MMQKINKTGEEWAIEAGRRDERAKKDEKKWVIFNCAKKYLCCFLFKLFFLLFRWFLCSISSTHRILIAGSFSHISYFTLRNCSMLCIFIVKREEKFIIDWFDFFGNSLWCVQSIVRRFNVKNEKKKKKSFEFSLLGWISLLCCAISNFLLGWWLRKMMMNSTETHASNPTRQLKLNEKMLFHVTPDLPHVSLLLWWNSISPRVLHELNVSSSKKSSWMKLHDCTCCSY